MTDNKKRAPEKREDPESANAFRDQLLHHAKVINICCWVALICSLIGLGLRLCERIV